MQVRTADVLGDAPTFDSLLLPPHVIRNLSDAGYRRPSPVQQATMPLARLGTDLLVQAKAGTGKTLVFAVAALERVDTSNHFPQALILAPTREIALQAADCISDAVRRSPIAVATFIGGLPSSEDERLLRRKCHIVVGTPGRILSLINRGALVTKELKMLVLDEADKLLVEGSELGEDVHRIIAALPEKRQTLAMSATYSSYALATLSSLMHRPHEVRVSGVTTALLGVAHLYLNVPIPDGITPSHEKSYGCAECIAAKKGALKRVLSSVTFRQVVVFCGGKAAADELAEELAEEGHAVEALSASKDQLERIRILNLLRDFSLRVVVATDLAARGIDLEKVNLVVNFDLPAESATLAHRIGRAGRFGTQGAAITLVCGDAELNILEQSVAAAGGAGLRELREPLPRGWSPEQRALQLDFADSSIIETKPPKTPPPPPPPPPPPLSQTMPQATAGQIVDPQQPQVLSAAPLLQQRPAILGGGGGGGDSRSNVQSPLLGNVQRMGDEYGASADAVLRASLWTEQRGRPLPTPTTDRWPLQLSDVASCVLPPAFETDVNSDATTAVSCWATRQEHGAIEDTRLGTEASSEASAFDSFEEQRGEESGIEHDDVDLSYTVVPSEPVNTTHYDDVVRSVQLDILASSNAAEDAVKLLRRAFQQQRTESQRPKATLRASDVDDEGKGTQQGGLGREMAHAVAQRKKAVETSRVEMGVDDATSSRQRRALGTAQAAAYSKQLEQQQERDALAAEAALLEALLLEESSPGEAGGDEAEKKAEQQRTELDKNEENERVWRDYWLKHFELYGYYPGGGPPAGEGPHSPPGCQEAPAAAASAESWTPTLDVAALGAIQDENGYVRVPAQLLQRYLQLEWEEWRRKGA